MNEIDIGSLTFFVNVSAEQEQILSDESIHGVVEVFEGIVRHRLNEQDLENIVLVRSSWKRGCLIINVSLTIPALVLGAYKFVLDYEKLRAGIKLIINDINGAKLLINRGAKKSGKANAILVNTGKKLVYSERRCNQDGETTMHTIAVMRDDTKDKSMLITEINTVKSSIKKFDDEG